MGETCELDPTRECHNSTAIALLQSRVDALEEGQGREESFRKVYYKDREDRVRRDTQVDERLKIIDENVKNLLARQSEEDTRPRRNWDKVIWAVISAVLTALVMKTLGL